jgi:thymidylate kinase
MKFIEFFGLVGAGKTTVAQATEKILLETGYEPIDLKTALGRGMERSLVGRLLRPFTDSARRTRLLKALYRQGVFPLYGMRLALVNPRLVGAAIRAQIGNGLPWWHKRRIWRLFFSVLNGRAFLAGRLEKNEIVLLEEGALHRAINLFAWQMDGLRHDLLAQYLEHLPAFDLAIFVEAPVDHCRQRSDERGLPRRLDNKDDGTADRFFENADQIVDLVASYTSASDRPIIIVDNSGRPGDFEPDFNRQLRNKLFVSSGVEPMPVVPRIVEN